MRRWIAAFLTWLALTGCASTPFEEIATQAGWPPQGTVPLTVPVALLADTQFHESRGVASRLLGRAGDEFVDVTVRTGQQVIGAGDVLRHALELARQFPLVLHAGDALDVSCETEWSLFIHVVTTTQGRPGPRSWLIAPGNHDGFHTGNIFPLGSGWYVNSYWSNMCNAGQMKKGTGRERVNLFTHMPKDRIVFDYLRMLAPLQATGDGTSGCDASAELCWSARVAADEPWTSYIVQRVMLPSVPGSLTPVYALLLDSSDFTVQPYLKPWTLAGERGSFSSRQLQAAYELVKGLPVGARYFFVAHHPASDWHASKWDEATRAVWRQMLDDPRSLRFLVSAHTHEGSLRKYKEHVGELTELNTGSLADAPIYIRWLQFERDAAGNVGVRSSGIPLQPSSAACHQTGLPQPRDGMSYGVDTQRSESNRASNLPLLLRYARAFLSGLGHLLRFWEAKHDELRPQLLAYADVVEATMPSEDSIRYAWTASDDGQQMVDSLHGAATVADALRKHANCATGAGRCSVQAKGNLLRAVEEFYWTRSGVPQDVRDRAHRARLCLALTAAEAATSTRERGRVLQLQRAIKREWSFQLRPPAQAD